MAASGLKTSMKMQPKVPRSTACYDDCAGRLRDDSARRSRRRRGAWGDQRLSTRAALRIEV